MSSKSLGAFARSCIYSTYRALHIAINPLTTASLAVSGAGIDRASIAISRANPMGEYGGDSGWDGGGTLRRGATLTFLRKSYIKKGDTQLV